MQHSPVAFKAEADVGPGQGLSGENGLDVPQLGSGPSQEFFSGRGIEEQVGHNGGGTLGHGRLIGFTYNAAAQVYLEALGLAFGPALEGHSRHRGDGRQGLAAKSEGGDMAKVFGHGDFGGGVALEGQEYVVGRHALSVVDDLDQPPAAGFDLDVDLCGPGVDGVFDQFF